MAVVIKSNQENNKDKNYYRHPLFPCCHK
jgi:hypothetical protein